MLLSESVEPSGVYRSSTVKTPIIMHVDFQLRRLSTPCPATALLFPAEDTGALLKVCAGLRPQPPCAIYAVAGGFVLKLGEPTEEAIPGVIRLRALAENLLLPVDATLIPTLLDDEASALVKHRGLVFLPRAVLEFSPDRPVSLASLLCVQEVDRGAWRAFPNAPPLADQIEEIKLDVEEPPGEIILESGREEIGSEDPWADAERSLPVRLAGKSALAAGMGLTWLGNLFGLKGLARAGSHLMSG